MDTSRLEIIAALRRQLHATPELSGHEVATIGTLRAFLSGHTSLRVEDRGGWLLAQHFEGDGLPWIAFRAEMDAIPAGEHGARHGCGHDGHSAILCGLALALEGARTGSNICLIFQPAEETGEGARMICESWPALKSLHRIYALHNIPGYPAETLLLRRGCFACASCGLIVRIQGRPAHAAYPEEGANPSGLLSRLVLEIPDMIREILAGDDRLLMHTVIGLRAGGENFGMSASEGQLCLTLRGYRQADIDALAASIEARARAGCAGSGMTCGFEFRDVFPDTTCNDGVVAESEARFRGAGLPVKFLDVPMRWSEDFGWYLQSVPGMYFGVGIGEDYPGLHTGEYCFDDAVIAPALRALEALAGLTP